MYLNHILFYSIPQPPYWVAFVAKCTKNDANCKPVLLLQRTWASYTGPVQNFSIFESCKWCIVGAENLDNRDTSISNHLQLENLLYKYSSIITSPFARLRWMDHGNSGIYGVREKWLRPSVTSFVSSTAFLSSGSQPIRASHMINGWDKTPGSPNAISCEWRLMQLCDCGRMALMH